MFFFFQAEDGIRDDLVTGVQTCALPICFGRPYCRPGHNSAKHLTPSKTDIFRTGTAFALNAANRGLGEPWRVEGSAKDEPGRALASRLIEGENHRWRTCFSSDFRGRWCWSGRWTPSPTTSRTSTPTATRTTGPCSKYSRPQAAAK